MEFTEPYNTESALRCVPPVSISSCTLGLPPWSIEICQRYMYGPNMFRRAVSIVPWWKHQLLAFSPEFIHRHIQTPWHQRHKYAGNQAGFPVSRVTPSWCRLSKSLELSQRPAHTNVSVIQLDNEIWEPFYDAVKHLVCQERLMWWSPWLINVVLDMMYLYRMSS